MSDQFLPNLMSTERGPMLALDNHIDLLRWWQRSLIRFLVALGDFMTDQIPFRRITNRPGVRRWERAKVGFPAEVRVVDLRVLEANPERNEVHGVVNWTHRWRSRAHIRRIRDKSTGEIKKIVPVRASVKGPAHLPLIERDTVFNVRR